MQLRDQETEDLVSINTHMNLRFSQRHEYFYLLGYNSVYSGESQPMIRRGILPPFSGWKSKPSDSQKQSPSIYNITCIHET
jgi:hypothetical protein